MATMLDLHTLVSGQDSLFLIGATVGLVFEFSILVYETASLRSLLRKSRTAYSVPSPRACGSTL
jgi:hypothetical protein